MTIARLIQGKGSTVTTVSEETAIHDVAKLLRDKRIGAVLVTDDEGHVAGVLSERDVVRGIATLGAALLGRPAREIMTAPVITVCPTQSIEEALALMTDRRIRHLPVVEEDHLIGIVSIGDLVKIRIEDSEREAAELKNYIAYG
jgi:CBS domain-containing protein